jgi:hypothetical protein
MTARRWVAAALLAAAAMGGAWAAGGRIEDLDKVAQIRPGVTTVQQVRDMFGPPARTLTLRAKGLQAMEYDARDYSDLLVISISYGSDGIVREVLRLRVAGPTG